MGMKICGRWEAVGFSCFAYNFLPDGTGFYSMADAKKEFKYDADGTRVIIHYPADLAPLSFKYEIDEDVLSIEDSFGNIVKYKKSKE